MMMRLIYVAGPYRGPNTWEVERNIRRAETLGMRVAELGAMPMIPHCNTRFFNGTLDDRFWLLGALEVMRRCDGAIFTRDWKRSSGARAEHDDAMARALPVFYTLDQLAAWLGPRPRYVPTEDQLPLFVPPGVFNVAG